jgi:sulfate transport system permease protein
MNFHQHGVLPGFGLSLGITISYLCLIALIQLAALLLQGAAMDASDFARAITSPRALAAFRLSLAASICGALLNAVFGLLLAWVLERYEFWGRRLVDGIVDLPFALPTAVAGIALTSLYAHNGWVGAQLARCGLEVAYAPLGIVVALTFVGLPFVVRTVQPVIRELPLEIEEAAASMGANRGQTFWRLLLPRLLPAVATGFTLAFARGLGEYGSVIFIAGNMPLKTEITPLLIMIRLEEYDYAGATAIALTFLGASFALLLFFNLLSLRAARLAAT